MLQYAAAAAAQSQEAEQYNRLTAGSYHHLIK